MESLQEIKTYSPEAFKAKPKGWKFIFGDTFVKEGDKIWKYGVGPFIPVNGHLHGEPAQIYNPIIREIKTAPKPPKVPDGLAIPKGYIFIGLGNNCHPTWKLGYSFVERFDDLAYYEGDWSFTTHKSYCSGDKMPIAAKIDSPLHRAQPWYLPKNIKDQLTDANKKIEELSKELTKYKAELQTYKTFYDRVKGLGL